MDNQEKESQGLENTLETNASPVEVENMVIQIFKLCEAVGWNVAVPNDGPEDAPIKGMIIGTDEYLNKILDAVELSETLDTIEKGSNK